MAPSAAAQTYSDEVFKKELMCECVSAAAADNNDFLLIGKSNGCFKYFMSGCANCKQEVQQHAGVAVNLNARY
jgi:hypothetical protein